MPVNGFAAPICPTTRSQAVQGKPGVLVPSVPRATDLPSAINAINQIIMILNPPVENNYFLQINNSAPFEGPRFIEVGRNVETVRIYNPNDKEQWVDVERITNLRMLDKENYGLWDWVY